MPGMVYSFRQTSAHERRRGNGTIEPRQRNHVHDRFYAGARLADHLADRIDKFHLGRGIGAIAEFFFQALKAKAVARAVSENAWHEKAGQSLRHLSEHKEGV